MYTKEELYETIKHILHEYSNRPGIQKYYISEINTKYETKYLANNIADAMLQYLKNDLTGLYEYLDERNNITDLFGDDLNNKDIQSTIFNYILDTIVVRNGDKYAWLIEGELICIR